MRISEFIGEGTEYKKKETLEEGRPKSWLKSVSAFANGIGGSIIFGVMEAIDDKEFSGSLITLLQSGEEFVKNNSKKRWKKTSNTRIEMPEYPQRAVLECIVNALIHRDYVDIGSEVHIDMYDNRLEIYSPGGMYDGSIVQNLDTDRIPSRRRNPIIADIFNRINYMERRGSGFRKIKSDYYKEANYKKELEPKFYSDTNSFWVTLFNLNYDIPIEDKKVAIEDKKVAIEDKKVAIEEIHRKCIDSSLSNIISNNIINFYKSIDDGLVFGRRDIVDKMDFSYSNAGRMINFMKKADILVEVRGKGKGKYQFKV